MKKIFLIILVFLQANLHAQKESKGIVYYGHKESFGMGAPIGVDYNAELIFNNFNSTYTFKKDSLEGGNIMSPKKIELKNKETLIIFKATTKQGLFYNINRKTKLIQSRDVGYNYIKDSIPKINWKISDETKKIGNFECSKATATFRGRDYTAWFSLEIPLPYGPWKLQGLPGLILEAYDTNKEIYFYFKSVEYPTDKEVTIMVPDPKTNSNSEKTRPTNKRKWISYKEYKKEIIKRHTQGLKAGRMYSEQTNNNIDVPVTSKQTYGMANMYLEVFDE